MPTFESDGLTLFYSDTHPDIGGRQTPVVLIHGFASTQAVNWVNPLWVKTLTGAGRRVIALDNRGHGASDKPHDPEAYHTTEMAGDVGRLLDHLALSEVHLIGYSMGARIAAFAALAFPARVRSVVLGGLGIHLVDRVGLPPTIADALLASSLDQVTDPMGRLFRRFAEANKGDLQALAACIRGSRQVLRPDELARITAPVLVAVGTRDEVAGDPHRLAALLPNGAALDIPGRDHNLAVGDKVFKEAVLRFLDAADGVTTF